MPDPPAPAAPLPEPHAGRAEQGGHGGHGGDLAAHRRRFPAAPSPPLDLSTGINPFAWPYPAPTPSPPPESLLLLPAADAPAALEAAAAMLYRRAPEELVALPGTATALAWLAADLARTRGAAAAGLDAAIVGPTYAGHARVLAAAGFAVREVADLGGAVASGAPLAVACRPNNPDGRVAPVDAVLGAAEALARRGGLLVVDEAFADLEPCGAALIGRPAVAGLALTRSFGKAWGLPGLRLGFAALPAARAARLRAWLGAWPVSGPALAIGTAALSDPGWLEAIRPRLDASGGALDRTLARIGSVPAGGTRLFRLVRHGRAGAVARVLGEAGILVRAFERDPALLRFGIPGGEAAQSRLDRALADKALETGPPCR